MNENNKKENNSGKVIAIILISILAFIALYMLFFNNMDDDTNNDMDVNIYNSANQITDTAENTIEIADANAKELYERVKKGITLDGKLIEVPANYMKNITNKVTATGYKITDDTKTAISNKLDEIENIIRGEGKTDINQLSESSQTKIQNIAKEIEDML